MLAANRESLCPHGMSDLVCIEEAEAGCAVLPFGIGFPTLADAANWLRAHGYAPQSSDLMEWARERSEPLQVGPAVSGREARALDVVEGGRSLALERDARFRRQQRRAG